jgi:hypothetical protein
MSVEPTSSPVLHRKYQEPVLGRGAFTFSSEHIAASIAPVFDPHSKFGTPGFQTRCEEFNNRLKEIQPIQPIHTGDPRVDVPNLQRYDEQRTLYTKIESAACEILRHNLKHCGDDPSHQNTLAHAGGGGDSAEIRNKAFNAS